MEVNVILMGRSFPKTFPPYIRFQRQKAMATERGRGSSRFTGAAVCVSVLITAVLGGLGFQSVTAHRRSAIEARKQAVAHRERLNQEQEARRTDRKRMAQTLAMQARNAFIGRDSYAALNALKEALEADPELPEAHLLKAQILTYQQDYAGAADCLRKYQALRPDGKEAGELLELCREAKGQKHSGRIAVRLARVFGRQGLTEHAALLAASVIELRDRHQADLKRAWPDLRNLSLRAAGDGSLNLYLPVGARDIPNLSPLRGMALNGLSFRDNRQLVGLGALQGMPLAWLDLGGCQQLSELGPLRGAPLRRLILDGTQVGDLSPLEGAPLEVLRLGGTQVEDLTPLVGKALIELDLLKTKVTDLTPIREMPLKLLNIGETKVTSIAPLQGLPLKKLDLTGTQIDDLSPLKGARLTELSLAGTAVTDLAFLLGMPVEKLDLSGCAEFADLSPLKGSSLRRLNLSGTKATDLSALGHLPLESLDLSGTPVTNLSALKGLPLTNLILDRCESLTDLTPLSGLPLDHLSLEGTKVADLRPLSGLPLSSLSLLGSSASDLGPLADLRLAYFAFSPEKITSGIEGIRNMQTLRGLRSWEGNYPIAPSEFWPRHDAHSSLREKNPNYTGGGNFRVEHGKVVEASLDQCQIADLNSLKVLPLRELRCGHNPITDISALARMPLQELFLWHTPVADITAVKGMPLRFFSITNAKVVDLTPIAGMSLETLSIDGTKIADLTPLKGMSLRHLALTPKNITKGMAIARGMKSLETIGITWDSRMPAADFWRRYDAGEFGRAAAAQERE